MERQPSRRVLHRETIRLALLIAIAVVAFFVTRAIAQRSHETARRDAAAWYRRGQQELERQNTRAAVAAFRRAVLKNREEKSHVLALADALVRERNTAAADRALRSIRELSPEDPVINLALARVAVERQDVVSAVRYYHNALYAPWPTADGPRRVRLELIRLLLAHNHKARATAELIAATIDLPDEPAARVDIGRLFASADDPVRALDQFTRALRIDPRHVGAAAGAVRTAFALGDYARVARHSLPPGVDDETSALVTLANLVITRDPLASRITAAERRRRLAANIAYVEGRWQACAARSNSGAAAEHPLLLRQLRAITSGRRSISRDADVLDEAMTLLYQLTREIERRCEDATALDRALLLIARRHGVNQP